MFTTSIDIAAAFLIACNVRRGWLPLSMMAGALIAVLVALAMAHVELVPPTIALQKGNLWTHAIFCAVCTWVFRALRSAFPLGWGRA